MRKFIVKVKSVTYEVEIEELEESDEFVIVQNPGKIADSNRTKIKEAFKAPMSGKLVKSLIGNGEEVAKGETMFVIEAMKLENDIISDRTGRVVKVCAKEGQNVEKGDVLAFIEHF